MLVDDHGKVAIKAICCATQIDGFTVVKVNGELKMHDEHMMGKSPNWIKNLCMWGEAGVLKLGKDGKMGDQGSTMIFVGYPLSHESDSIRMWNPDTIEL